MLDPIFSSTDLFLRDPGPRRHSLGGSLPRDGKHPGFVYPERDTDHRRR